MYNVIGQLTVNLIDTKNISIITNLNATIPLPEDAPDGSEIFQVIIITTCYQCLRQNMMALYKKNCEIKSNVSKYTSFAKVK